jgi:hypothetical protein
LEVGFTLLAVGSHVNKQESGLHVMAAPSILLNMDITAEDRRPSEDTARWTPRERLEGFVALQRRATQLLAVGSAHPTRA